MCQWQDGNCAVQYNTLYDNAMHCNNVQCNTLQCCCPSMTGVIGCIPALHWQLPPHLDTALKWNTGKGTEVQGATVKCSEGPGSWVL